MGARAVRRRAAPPGAPLPLLLAVAAAGVGLLAGARATAPFG